MRVLFHKQAQQDYEYFSKNDTQLCNKINSLIESIKNSAHEVLGKPEPLKYSLAGFWSRRITREHRLVYTIKENNIYILQCRYHYQ